MNTQPITRVPMCFVSTGKTLVTDAADRPGAPLNNSVIRVPVRFASTGKTLITEAAHRFGAPLNNYTRCALVVYARALDYAWQEISFYEQSGDRGRYETRLSLPTLRSVRESTERAPSGKTATVAVANGRRSEPAGVAASNLHSAVIGHDGAVASIGPRGDTTVEFKLRPEEFDELDEICHPRQQATESAGAARKSTRAEVLRAALRFFSLIVEACITRKGQIICKDKFGQSQPFLDAAQLAALRDGSLLREPLRLPEEEPLPAESQRVVAPNLETVETVPEDGCYVPADCLLSRPSAVGKITAVSLYDDAFEQIRTFVIQYNDCEADDPSFQEQVCSLIEQQKRLDPQRSLPTNLFHEKFADIKLQGEYLCHLRSNPICLLYHNVVFTLDEGERSALIDRSAYFNSCRRISGEVWGEFLLNSSLHRQLEALQVRAKPARIFVANPHHEKPTTARFA